MKLPETVSDEEIRSYVMDAIKNRRLAYRDDDKIYTLNPRKMKVEIDEPPTAKVGKGKNSNRPITVIGEGSPQD